MKVSVLCPVLDEHPWIGYSIMAGLPYVHEFIYALDRNTSDGTRELLRHIISKYAGDKVKIIDTPNFHPSNMKAYNQAFNSCIEESTGDACWFLHPDMLITKWDEPEDGPLAWVVNVTSYAGDFNTRITRGRAKQWKNIHAKKFGLHYYGGYGSQNEDFYHSDITGKSYKHFGGEFSKYPYRVGMTGIEINHYCELKSYRRRLEKMKLCLKTQNPSFADDFIHDLAVQHPRVTLEQSSTKFGAFEFKQTGDGVPEVITKYKDEFESIKEKLLVKA